MELVAAGVSHRSAPLAVRERAAVPQSEARTLLRYLVGHSGLSAAAVLSTCNRSEFYLISPNGELSGEVVPRLARYLDPSGTGGVAEHLIARSGRDAVQHMFRVAAGLDSMVVGEAQILGQFKSAHRDAREAGTLDPRLDFVMRRAVSVGKRVRTETGLGRRTGSISAAAVEHARRSLGGLEDAGVLLLGAGKMSALAARRLAADHARVFVVSRGGESAEALAAELGGRAISLDGIDDVAGSLDVIIGSTSQAEPVLAVADVERLQRRRSHRPLCILDIAVPRDVEPDAARVPGVTLVDLDGLGEVIERNLEGRRSELPAAERIIETEIEPTLTVIGERDTAGPTIAALTRWAEQVRRREMERSLPRLVELEPTQRTQLDQLTRSLVRKLLHPAIAHLKDNAEDPAVALFLRESFDLDDGRAG